MSSDSEDEYSAESDTSLSPPTKRKKGVRNDSKYKRNAIKQAKIQGHRHVNWKGSVVEERKTGEDCKCKKKCFEYVNENARVTILKNFNAFKTKDEQDIFLQGIILYTHPKQIKKVNNKQPKSGSYKYFVLKGGERLEICRKAFLSVHGVSSKRVYRICQLLQAGITPTDKRGKKGSCNAISGETCSLISEHIKSFPFKISHYSGNEMKYLDARLSTLKMYNMFKQKYPEIKFSYWFYWKYFKENFSLRFGRPQVDTCSFCEENGAKLRSGLNDTAKRVVAAELVIHKRRAGKFYKKIETITKLCKEKDDVAGLCFDFMSNLPLPNIPVQDIFYYRQLWVNTFGIHNLVENKAKLYVYHEGVAKKSPNEICSFLFEYINNNINPNIQELHIFSDNCAGQNKNHTVIRFLLALVDIKRFKKIYQYFPIRGHSFLPCDRDFALIKRQVKKCDRLYVPEEYIILMKKSAKRDDKFTVKEIESADVLNFKDWWQPFYKKNALSNESLGRSIPRSQKQDFAITKFMEFEYSADRPGTIIAHPFIDGLMKYTYVLKKSDTVNITPATVYSDGNVPINQKKIDDIKKVLQYVPAEHQYFYEDIVNWPTTNDTE